jgi:hypothetical protein
VSSLRLDIGAQCPHCNNSVGNFDVVGVPEEAPNLLGQVPLEVLDFVVDSRRQKLTGNPAHAGEQMTEEYFAAPATYQLRRD